MANTLAPPAGNDVADDICAALGVTDDATKAKYRQVYTILYAALQADIAITIAALSIGTTGGPASQTGPQLPIIINPA